MRYNLTDELANWVLRINALFGEKDTEIKRLRANNEFLCDELRAIADHHPDTLGLHHGGDYKLLAESAAGRAKLALETVDEQDNK